MARDRVERQLEHLKDLRLAGPSEAAVKEIRKALSDSVNVIVAKAAGIAGEWQERTLLPDLLNAFARLFLKLPASDPQCWGKNAIAKTLKDFGHAASAIFLQGLQHRQWESSWGGKTDTANVLRGTCALALVQCTDIPRHETLLYLVDALADHVPTVRADVARALQLMCGRDVELLLRLKALVGDTEVGVTAQVLESLLQLEGAAGIPFVAGFLQHMSEEIREEAALTLGASRLPEAVEILKQEWLTSQLRSGEVILRALSASRLDSALDFLLDQVRTARLHLAEDALRALELHRDSEQIVKRVEEAALSREELRPLFRERFVRT